MNRIKFHVKKGDQVEVISGNFRGSSGKILEVLPRKQRVLIEGVRIIKKHLRKSQDNPSGKIAEREGPIHISNVKLIERDKKAEKKALDEAKAELALITGQRPVETRAKKSISNFKLRKDQAIGAKVTLRGERMYEFLERFIKAALPRIRDFRGVSPRCFDRHGNYTLGVSDQSIFPEVELDKIKRNIGFDVTIVTTARTDEEAKSLLSEMGMPFSDRAKKPAAQAA